MGVGNPPRRCDEIGDERWNHTFEESAIPFDHVLLKHIYLIFLANHWQKRENILRTLRGPCQGWRTPWSGGRHHQHCKGRAINVGWSLLITVFGAGIEVLCGIARPPGDRNEIRNERRNHALQKCRVPPYHVLIINFSSVRLVDNWSEVKDKIRTGYKIRYKISRTLLQNKNMTTILFIFIKWGWNVATDHKGLLPAKSWKLATGKTRKPWLKWTGNKIKNL